MKRFELIGTKLLYNEMKVVKGGDYTEDCTNGQGCIERWGECCKQEDCCEALTCITNEAGGRCLL